MLVENIRKALIGLHYDGLIELRQENELEVASAIATAVEKADREQARLEAQAEKGYKEVTQ